MPTQFTVQAVTDVGMETTHIQTTSQINLILCFCMDFLIKVLQLQNTEVSAGKQADRQEAVGRIAMLAGCR